MDHNAFSTGIEEYKYKFILKLLTIENFCDQDDYWPDLSADCEVSLIMAQKTHNHARVWLVGEKD